MITPLALAALSFLYSSTSIPVYVQKVFFPSDAYDVAENVQILAEGELPDLCYEVNAPKVQRQGNTFTLVASAWRKRSEACDSGDLIPEGTFLSEISLGRLEAGDYLINFTPEEGAAPTSQTLHVAEHRAQVGRSTPAQVLGVDTPRVTLDQQHLKITVSGPLSHPCDEIQATINTENPGNTMIVDLVERPSKGQCEFPSDRFNQVVDLGVLPPGEHLVHVRNGLGGAIQKIVTVVKT